MIALSLLLVLQANPADAGTRLVDVKALVAASLGAPSDPGS